MKAIFYDSDKIVSEGILYGLLEVGIDVTRSELKVTLDDLNAEQIDIISDEVKNFDFAISRSFSVNIAEGCHIAETAYISWSYDSPVRALYRKEALYPINRVFVFDKKQLARLKAIGLENVYYEPLAANMTKAALVNISESDLIRFDRDVSFIGSLYDKGYYESFMKEAPQCLDDCESLLNKSLCKWDGSVIFDNLNERCIDSLYRIVSKENRELYSMSDRFLTELIVLSYELSRRERVEILNASAQHFDTVIHTYDPDKFKDILKARTLPPIDFYSDDIFRIYAASKINLNITLRSIESGVPQRVFDILSVGGFVMSNYQEEAAELFEPDKEIVLFRSTDEFIDKATYYIANEKKRLEIGARGYLKCRDKYNYANSIRSMLSKL